ncbi:MAG: sigma-70 RNA polymerase sigma factor region 4 domain-containing protein [Planctomycetota bacterium]|jgi:transposase-like protein
MRGLHRNITNGEKLCTSLYGERIDLLKSRLELLGGKDRALLKMYLDNGNTFRQMARIAGVNEVTISRRIYKLIQRLLDGEYIICLRNRTHFTSMEMSVAKDYFLLGLSMRRIAAKERITYHSVRQTLKKIQFLVEVRNKRGGRSDLKS